MRNLVDCRNRLLLLFLVGLLLGVLLAIALLVCLLRHLCLLKRVGILRSIKTPTNAVIAFDFTDNRLLLCKDLTLAGYAQNVGFSANMTMSVMEHVILALTFNVGCHAAYHSHMGNGCKDRIY